MQTSNAGWWWQKPGWWIEQLRIGAAELICFKQC